MPRAEAKSGGASSATPYPAPSTSASAAASHTAISDASAAAKRKHVCPTCDRGFTTSGHLARHSRVHTGERNHRCPFPGCETRCSRQDNLQQHYRIHLSPGSRRVSGRALKLKRASQLTQTLATSPLVCQPAATRSPPPPPNTPPPLEQAPLAALAAAAASPAAASPTDSSSSGVLNASRSNTSSPEVSYSPPQYVALGTSQSYGYRSAYHDSPSQYGYVPTVSHHSYESFVDDYDGRYVRQPTYEATPVRQPYEPRPTYDDGSSWGSRASPIYDGRAPSALNTYAPTPSRHSISHIAPSYKTEPRRESLSSISTMSAPSPTASSESADSAPTTPSFPYHDGSAIVAQSLAAGGNYAKPIDQPVADYQKPAYAYSVPSSVVYDQPPPYIADPRAQLVLPPLDELSTRPQYQPRAAYQPRVEYLSSQREQYVQPMDRVTYDAREEYAQHYQAQVRPAYHEPYDMPWKPSEGAMRGRMVGAHAR